jgi:biopolymer transport protein ExbD
MKKCSKSAHSTVTEMNITPLLDLAFVLLVIFILTTTPITNDLALELPKAAQRPAKEQAKIQFVTVDAGGKYYLNRQQMELAALRDEVIHRREGDPDLNVVIRGDAKAPYRFVREALDAMQQCNLAKVRLATEAYRPKP